MHKKFFLILSSVLLLIFLTSCEEKKGIVEQTEVFSIQPVSVPSRLNISRTKPYGISFRVTHPKGVDAIASVSATFFAANQSDTLLTIDLYDDGGVNHPGDTDVIARDGIFTNTFLSDSSVFPLGIIYVKASVFDNAQRALQTDFIPCVSLFNKAPVLVSFSAPDTLPSGSQPVLFSVTVQDSNGIEDVPSVIFRLKRQNLTVFSTELNSLSTTAVDSGLYGAYFDSTFAAERIGGYQLEFQAVDLSEDSSNVLTQAIYLENTAPEIFNLQMVDSLQLPLGSEANTTLIEIWVNDSQGLSDIDSVYFNSVLPNDSAATNNPFIMYDNGLPFNPNGSAGEAGDLVANDGTYSLTIALFSNTPTGRYKFFFFARDKVGQLTPGPVDSIFVFQ